RGVALVRRRLRSACACSFSRFADASHAGPRTDFDNETAGAGASPESVHSSLSSLLGHPRLIPARTTMGYSSPLEAWMVVIRTASTPISGIVASGARASSAVRHRAQRAQARR